MRTYGDKIEPKFFIPILPTVLINGAQGMGTGHATLIFSYNPADIKDATLKLLNGKKLNSFELTPWFRGFTGEVARDKESGQVTTTGKMTIINTTTIKISELPVGMESDPYEAHLFKLQDRGIISDFDFQYEDGYEITVKVPRTTTAKSEEELYKLFKLVSKDSENFTVWGSAGFVKRFKTPEELLEEFVIWRLEKYAHRRQKLIDITKADIVWTSEKVRFINFYLKNTSLFKNTGKQELVKLLIENKFDAYDRLLSMQIWSLTRDRIKELEKELDERRQALKLLEADTAKEMYVRELKGFKHAS